MIRGLEKFENAINSIDLLVLLVLLVFFERMIKELLYLKYLPKSIATNKKRTQNENNLFLKSKRND